MSDSFVIERGNHAGPVNFEGDMLGSATSHSPSKSFWTEITVYRTVGQQYVVHINGATSVPGKVQRHTVNVYKTASEVIVGLIGKNGNMSALAYETLDMAADDDVELCESLDAYDVQTAQPTNID